MPISNNGLGRLADDRPASFTVGGQMEALDKALVKIEKAIN